MISNQDNQNPKEEENFLTLHDSSELVKVMPSKLIEPAIIVAHILGYENVDVYATELIRLDLVSYHLDVDQIKESFQEYLEKFVDSEEQGDE